jgi:hypothetical protein
MGNLPYKGLSEKPSTLTLKVSPRAKIPPPAASRLSAPFSKGGGEGVAERGICPAQRSKKSKSYSDRR